MGDFDKPETLTVAFRGLDKLVIIPTTDMVAGARSKQAVAAIEKAGEAGVRHVSYLSAVGTRFAKLPHLWESYFVPEQALMRSAKEWSILRMAFYAESFLDRANMSLARGVYASSSSAPVNLVARGDVAAAAAGLIATEGHHGAIYNATGPEALDGPARASVVAQVTGKPFAFAQVPLDAAPCRHEGRGPPASGARRCREHRRHVGQGDLRHHDGRRWASCRTTAPTAHRSRQGVLGVKALVRP